MSSDSSCSTIIKEVRTYCNLEIENLTDFLRRGDTINPPSYYHGARNAFMDIIIILDRYNSSQPSVKQEDE